MYTSLKLSNRRAVFVEAAYSSPLKFVGTDFHFTLFCSVSVFGTASKIDDKFKSKAAAETVPFIGDRQS